MDRLPRHVETLEEAPPEYRLGYVENPAGGFDLHPDVIEAEDRANARLEEARSLTERRMRQLRKAIIDLAVADGLRAGGIAPNMIRAAAALLAERYPMSVEDPLIDDAVATAMTPYGPMPARSLALQWANSEEARAMRTRTAAEPLGPFSAALMALRDGTRH